MPESLNRCLTIRQLSRRWQCRDALVRAMVRNGQLATIQIGRAKKITPETIAEAERGMPTARPRTPRRRRDEIPAEIRDLQDA